MNEHKMRVYAEFEAMHEEFMELLPAADSPLDGDSPSVALKTDEDVEQAINLLQLSRDKLQEYRDIPWE
jgi:hypothetical protein